MAYYTEKDLKFNWEVGDIKITACKLFQSGGKKVIWEGKNCNTGYSWVWLITQWTKIAGRCLRCCMTYENMLIFSNSEGVTRFKHMHKTIIIVALCV